MGCEGDRDDGLRDVDEREEEQMMSKGRNERKRGDCEEG